MLRWYAERYFDNFCLGPRGHSRIRLPRIGTGSTKILKPVLREIPNSLHRSAICSPASRRATNCSLSSMTEHSFHGIHFLLKKGESVTYVSGTFCHLCVGSLTGVLSAQSSRMLL